MKGAQETVVVVFAATAIVLFFMVVDTPHDAFSHSAIDSGTTVKNVDKYRIAFQQYPAFASAGQNATLHFSILDKGNSSVNGVYAAMVMKEKDGKIVEQMPYRFYEFGDISIPYEFHDNEDYVATLLTRIDGDSKYMASPLAADFDIPVRSVTAISPTDIAIMVVPVTAALVGGIVLLFRKKWLA